MPYFVVDDGAHSHPKVVKAGTHAFGLWSRCGSWSAKHGTDGFVPDYIAATFDVKYKALAARLVSAGLWTVAKRDDEGGWQFHDWTGEEDGVRRNYTRAETLRKRQEWNDRQARSRKNRRGGDESAGPNVTRDTPRDTPRDSARDTPRDNNGDSRVSHGPVTESLSLSLKPSVVTQGAPVTAVAPPRAGAREYVPDFPQSTGQSEEPAPTGRPRIICPEDHGESMWDCFRCKAEHGSPRFYADPANWPEPMRTGRWTRGDYAKLTGWLERQR